MQYVAAPAKVVPCSRASQGDIPKQPLPCVQDVTEPLAFFSQLVVQIGAFMYFLWTRVDFSNSTLRQRAYERHLRRFARK